MKTEFQKALPSHIPVDRFVRVVQTAVASNPSLLSYDRNSLWQACTKAAELGLMPDNKHAALVPFKDRVQFMSMIAGKLKLARNSGEIKTIDAQIIYEKDEFDYYIDEKGPHLKHKPNLLEERGSVKGAYAIGETKDGGVYIEVMTNDQINSIEKMSKGSNTPWKGPFRSEMIRKSVLNRLLKRLPTSIDLEKDTDNDFEMYEIKDVANDKPILEEKKPSNLKAAIFKSNEHVEEEIEIEKIDEDII